VFLHAELAIDDVIHYTLCNSWDERIIVSERYCFRAGEVCERREEVRIVAEGGREGTRVVAHRDDWANNFFWN